MPNDKIDKSYWKNEIDKMTHEDCARFYRFGESTHVIFQDVELWVYFKKRFDSFGGFNAEISKKIGWSPI
jgi:hypothetical protein